MKNVILASAAMLAAMSAPALAQDNSAAAAQSKLTTPGAQTQTAQPEMTEQQKQVQQVLRSYMVMKAVDTYASKCGALPPGEDVLLNAQIGNVEGRLKESEIDLSADVETATTDAAAAECGTGDYQKMYEMVQTQLQTPVDVLVMGFNKVEPSCRAQLLDGGDGPAFDKLAAARSAHYEGELPAQLSQGVQETQTSLTKLCTPEEAERLAQAKGGVQVASVQAALDAYK